MNIVREREREREKERDIYVYIKFICNFYMRIRVKGDRGTEYGMRNLIFL